MKKNQWEYVMELALLILCLLFGEQLLFQSHMVRRAVQNALTLCIENLIPSLFCFMVLTCFLSTSGLSRLLCVPLLPLSRFLCLPADCGSIFLLSMIGGYPVGIKALADAYHRKQLSEKLLRRMACFCVAPAPSFVIIAVGAVLLQQPMAGLLIYCAQLLAALFLALLTSLPAAATGKMEIVRFLSQKKHPSYSQALVEAVQFSSSNMLVMCGYVLLFQVLSALLSQLPLKKELWACLFAFLEISSGSTELCSLSIGYKLPLLAFFLSFGGVSVLFQLKSILKDAPCPMILLLCSRICHGLLSAIFTAILLSCFPQATPALSSLSTPLPIMNSNTPLLSACLIAMLLIFLGSFDKSTNS